MVRKANETENNDTKKSGLFDLSRAMLLAAIGAAAIAEEEIYNFVERLVDRGEIAEKDARDLMQEILDRRETILREKKEEQKRKSSAPAATRSDIEELNKKISELSEKIETLKKSA